jgi:hypothetical protein
MNEAAYHGLAGEVVRVLEPHTEADPAGLLTSFLTAFGAAVGAGPHAVADGARHPARLDVVLVGRSARARKGTSWAVIRRVLAYGAPDLVGRRVVAGMSTGEGLVADLAERSEGDERAVLVVEPEVARLLRSASRSASLSALLRQAWDGDDLQVLTRTKPLKASGASVSLIGHVTAEELRRRLTDVEASNGFGNRLLFVGVERARRLPLGAEIPNDDLEVLGARLAAAIRRARTLGRLTFSEPAQELWALLYESFDDDVRGIVGSLLARAEAQLLRLAATYALTDGSPLIETHHLQAAEAVWRHCEATVHRVFGDHEPDHVAIALIAALRTAGAAGLDGTQQRDLFARHAAGHRLAAARADLERRGLARTVLVETGGRPRIVTRLTSCSPVPYAGFQGPVSSPSSPAVSPVSSPQSALWITRAEGSDNGAFSRLWLPSSAGGDRR